MRLNSECLLKSIQAIVGHSKGGLDARVFLDITDTKDIANLIMIGICQAWK
jgi:hypothetical protein